MTTGNILGSLTGTHDLLVQAKYFSLATNCACVRACVCARVVMSGHVCPKSAPGGYLTPSNRAGNEFVEINK